MKLFMPKTSRIVLAIAALCLLFLALIWVSYFRQKSFDRRDAIQFAVEKNSNLAVALEQYTISTLHNADAVLQLVRVEYAHEGPAINLQKLQASTKLSRDIIQAISIINSEGKLVTGNDAFFADAANGCEGTTFFTFHSKNNIDSLLISKPFTAKRSGKTVIVISRRLTNVKGDFEGLVTLQMQPSKFTSFYAQAKLLPNDIISLIAPDGTTYARRTGNKETAGENIHNSPLFARVAQNTDSFYFASDAIKHLPSWFSYRKLKDYPIIATVGSSEHDILNEYAVMQSRIKMPRIITSVLVVLFSVLLAIVLLYRQNTSERLAAEKERYERLLTEQMIAVQEREREWIGRELHDNVSQVLTTVKLYLEMASKQQDNPLIPRSMQLINSSIVEIRNLSHQLSAPTLGTRSLIDSINALIETLQFSSALQFQFDHNGFKDDLVMGQKLALYRILQEQVNNIIRHAGATKVWISLSQQNNNVILSVRDNGKGFNSSTKTNGMGLNNMVSRVKVFGGSVQIKSAPQQGCFLRVTAPVVMPGAEQYVYGMSN